LLSTFELGVPKSFYNNLSFPSLPSSLCIPESNHLLLWHPEQKSQKLKNSPSHTA
jgi:hypothetical protein